MVTQTRASGRLYLQHHFCDYSQKRETNAFKKKGSKKRATRRQQLRYLDEARKNLADPKLSLQKKLLLHRFILSHASNGF